MSIPVSQQHQLIKKYFNSLVKEFITDPLHNKDISIVFVDHLKSSKPGSTTMDENDLRSTAVHEFAHLYLYATIGLSPRVDKSRDYDQYEDNHSEKVDNQENTCPECSYPLPNHSPQCSPSFNQPHPHPPKPGQNQKPDIINDLQTATELDRLKKLLNSSQNLSTLESIYQNEIKSNPLYQGKDNQKTLDHVYELQRHLLQFSSNNRLSSTNGLNSANKNKLGNTELLLIYQDTFLLKTLTDSQMAFLAKTYQLEGQKLRELENNEKAIVLFKDKEDIEKQLVNWLKEVTN
ncbi:8018_t:CDS:2 [Funneliformis geosporum]|uniref:1148_t:CDS:1 n=1 Tax=Funneliformis geosporum TaxID=1117311 RepID=A0A9W4SVN8_9GLOM|nr:8018_t:CDS:2 [Funneliformis geosporum]CAI2183298.1 1148_t:CDS:2 [Funneliformis geosporum]